MVGQGHRLSDIAVRNPEPPWHSVPSRLSSAAAGTSRALAPVHKSQAQQHLSENTPLRSQSLKAATEVIELVDSLSSLTMALILKLRTPYGRSTKKNISSHPASMAIFATPWSESSPVTSYGTEETTWKNHLNDFPVTSSPCLIPIFFKWNHQWLCRKHLIFAFIIFQTGRMLAAH